MAIPPLFFALMIFFISNMVYGETIGSLNSQNEAVISDIGLGVEIGFDKDGNLLSIKSTSFYALEFQDRKSLYLAYIKAEENAKANISRFMNESITSSTILTKIEESISKSQSIKNNNSETWGEENTRHVTKSLKKIITNFSRADLQSVRILERVYDESNKEVKVVVGVNKFSKDSTNQASNFRQ